MPRAKPSRPTVAPQESGRVTLRLGALSLAGYLLTQVDFLAVAACSLLAVYGSSSWLAQASLAGLRISLSTKQTRARSGEPVDARITLKNENRILPVFHPTFTLLEQSTPRRQTFQYHGIVYPKSAVTLSIDPTLRQRGLRRMEAVQPRSQFPFALHQAQSKARAQSPEIIVWPRPATLDVDSLLHDPPRFRYQTTGEQSFHHDTVEAARIRDYQAGDPRSRINWKLSAKRDKLTLIEPREERKQRYDLHLETSKDLWPSELAFERMLRLVTSLVFELSRRKTAQGITLDHVHYPLTNNREIIRFYDALALASPSPTPNPLDAAVRHGRCHLWILPAPNSEILLASQAAPTFEKEAAQ